MISKKDVQHIASLARIELMSAEEQKFEHELSAILEFVAKLNELDTSKVEPLTGGTDLINVMREDEIQGITDRGQGLGLVESAPKQRDGYVEVKAVFKRE